MRLRTFAIVGLAAAGPALSQSATATWEAQAGPGGVTVYQPTLRTGATGVDGRLTTFALQPTERPGPDASIYAIRSYVQEQQREARQLQIDGKPVTLRATGASLQVYLGDEPYPESRMKGEGERTLLLDTGGKPAGQMLVEGQLVRLAPVGEGQQAQGRLLIGVSLSPVDPTLAKHLKIEADKASMISSVTDGWPASKAGLGSGDVIVSVEGRQEGTSGALREAIGDRKAGDSIRLGVLSGGGKKDVTVTLSDEARASVSSGFATTVFPAEMYRNFDALGVGAAASGEYSRELAETLNRQAQVLSGQQLRAATQNRLWRAGQAAGSTRAATEQADAQRVRERAAVVEREALSEWATAAAREGARVTVDIPAGGGRAVVTQRPEGDIARRLSALEERMARIEALLQQLTERAGGR